MTGQANNPGENSERESTLHIHLNCVYFAHTATNEEYLENFSLPVCNTLKSASVASITIPSAKELINCQYATSKLTTAISKVIYFCPLHVFNPTGEKGLLSLNCQNNQSYHKLLGPYTFQLSSGKKKKKITSKPTENSSLQCKYMENTSLNMIQKHLKFIYLPGIAVNLL